MKKCPFCGRRLTDEQFDEYQRLKRAEGGKAKTDRKKAASAENVKKARAALTPERRREIAQKAVNARWEKLRKQQEEQQDKEQ